MSGEVLGYYELCKLVDAGVIRGVREGAIQPASIDLYIADDWDAVALGTYRKRKGKKWKKRRKPPFALTVVNEEFAIPLDLVGFIHGVSTIARQFVIPHAAGLLDPGYQGRPTLEVMNMSLNPFRLEPGMRIAQVVFHRVVGAKAYEGRYQGDRHAQGPKEE